MKCIPIFIVPQGIIAESVNDGAKVSSVGQEIGVDVTFVQTGETGNSFVNDNWESGGF